MKMIFILFLCAFLVSSCCIQGKIEEARKIITEAKIVQQKEKENISQLHNSSSSKLAQGKIDSNILNLISGRMSRFDAGLALANENIKSVEVLINNPAGFRKKYKLVVLPMLDSVKKNTGLFEDRTKLYAMIGDGLDIANYQLFDLAAFFGPGKYSVPEDKRETASTSFSPIVDSIISFSNKYQTTRRTGSLIVLGFADGTGFSPGPLYDFLSGKIGKNDASKEELNQKLSELRAEELISILTGKFEKKANEMYGKEILKLEYFGQGKGEKLPLPTINNYQVNDERRRIVLCYWTVLPD